MKTYFLYWKHPSQKAWTILESATFFQKNTLSLLKSIQISSFNFEFFAKLPLFEWYKNSLIIENLNKLNSKLMFFKIKKWVI